MHLAPYCILVSALFDFLDGFIARLLKVPSELGKQLDSLADMLTFGVAPGIFMFQLIRLSPWTEAIWFREDLHSNYSQAGHFLDPNQNDWVFEVLSQQSNPDLAFHITRYVHTAIPEWMPYLAFLIPIFAMFRLAKFNLDNSQSSSFIGLPTPAMTLFFAPIPLMILQAESEWQLATMDFLLQPMVLVSLSIILSILMVVPLPLFSLKFKSFGWKGNEIRWIFLTMAVGLLATLFVWALPLIIILYLLLSIISNLVNKPKNEIQSGN